MYGMRHPQKLGIISNNNYLTQEYINSKSEYQKLSSSLNLSTSPSTPSLPGFAFAILAASFPLLRTKDSLITTSITLFSFFNFYSKQLILFFFFYIDILTLTRKALPFLFELNIQDHINDPTIISQNNNRNRNNNYEQLRVEHLFKRLDQVFISYYLL